MQSAERQLGRSAFELTSTQDLMRELLRVLGIAAWLTVAEVSGFVPQAGPRRSLWTLRHKSSFSAHGLFRHGRSNGRITHVCMVKNDDGSKEYQPVEGMGEKKGYYVRPSKGHCGVSPPQPLSATLSATPHSTPLHQPTTCTSD